MKKMMAMMAALLVAGAASAASITWNWSFGASVPPDYTFATVGSVIMYLTDPSSPFTSDMDLSDGNGASGTWIGDHTVLSGKNVTLRFTTDFGSGMVYAEYTATIGVLSGEQNTDASALDGWIGTALNEMLIANGDGSVAFDPGTGTWTPVPEPSSMALLALGAAAFGLRRKFRK